MITQFVAKALTATFVLGLSVTAWAKPLVTMQGTTAKPGVVTAWSGSGNKIELTLEAGADAAGVAAAISANVAKVKATVKAGKILVVGKTQPDLLKALAGVDYGDGDLGALAQASLGSDDDSGSSLRAKKTAAVDKKFSDRSLTAEGTVDSVSEAAFPDVVVKVKIVRQPSGALGEKIRKGQTIAFTPAMKKNGAALDLADEDTQLNLGAYYLKKGDTVRVKIGAADKEGFVAELLTR